MADLRSPVGSYLVAGDGPVRIDSGREGDPSSESMNLSGINRWRRPSCFPDSGYLFWTGAGRRRRPQTREPLDDVNGQSREKRTPGIEALSQDLRCQGVVKCGGWTWTTDRQVMCLTKLSAAKS